MEKASKCHFEDLQKIFLREVRMIVSIYKRAFICFYMEVGIMLTICSKYMYIDIKRRPVSAMLRI